MKKYQVPLLAITPGGDEEIEKPFSQGQGPGNESNTNNISSFSGFDDSVSDF